MQEIIEQYKSQEQEHAYMAVVILDDDQAIRLLAAWSPDIVVPNEDRDPVLDTWADLWDSIGIDYPAWSRRSGLGEKIIARKFEILKSAYLIYPDGAIAGHVKAILKAKLARSIGVK